MKTRSYRLVTNPELPERDVKVFPGDDWCEPGSQRLLNEEVARPGALLYTTASYPEMCLMLDNTDGLKGVPEIRLCAGGRGYVKFDRRPGGPALPPEDAVVKVMESAPALPRPGSASVTIRQDSEHPEGVVVAPPRDRSLVDRFIDAYMGLGGTFGGLVESLETVREAARGT